MSGDPHIRTAPSPMLCGFGNHHSSEAVKGALPIGQNSPQHVPYGLYAEQFSVTAFTAPRAENRRSWLYRLRPSAAHPPYTPLPSPAAWQGLDGTGRGADHGTEHGGVHPIATPNRLRWDPLPLPTITAPDGAGAAPEPVDFLSGLVPYGRNGGWNDDGASQQGATIYLYAATCSMKNRAFFSADGEFLIVPQQGRLRIRTEMGPLDVGPLDIALIPRGLRFQVLLQDDFARGYVCENHGAPFHLPELGPIGANGLANVRDFEAPHAAYQDLDEPFEVIQKFQGRLWTTTLNHSPFDVVAWHGNAAPYRYDLRRFNTMNSVSFDHPDPSIFTLFTSPSPRAGTANLDFVIFPPRWMVAEQSFRPPWFHRNIMSEFMGLICGAYDAKASGFAPGGASLHNCMAAHGPDAATHHAATTAALRPQKLDGTMAFMFESHLPFIPTAWSLETPLLQSDYDRCWDHLPKAQIPQIPVPPVAAASGRESENQ